MSHKCRMTLKEVAKRDKDICWLCGKKVDWHDYHITKDGNMCAGWNYPSIDHVIPLSKGGTDTPDNVRLAHRKCNSLKDDKIIGAK